MPSSAKREYVSVANWESISSCIPYTFEIDDRFVVVVRIGDEVFCLDDVCTHDGGTFSEGDVDNFCIECPRHGAKFDLRTGDAVTMPATEATAKHQAKVEDGRVWIKLADD